MIPKKRALSKTPTLTTSTRSVSVAAVATIPEEAVWLASRKSPRTRRAYKHDVEHFMRLFRITTPEQLRTIDHKAVMLWERRMREDEGLEASTVRRRLAALSSLFMHLVKFNVVTSKPVRDVERPAINRREGVTPAFSAQQARKILDSPAPESLLGLRDRAILSVALQCGLRRSEIAWLSVGDVHITMGFDALKVRRKGGKRGIVTINQQTKTRIESYLDQAGHDDDLDGPLFRPVRGTKSDHDTRRHLHDKEMYRIIRKYTARAGIDARGFCAHSARATFITEALRNGASIEDVQTHVGHADISTTKLYDRRRHNPEKSPAFYVNY